MVPRYKFFKIYFKNHLYLCILGFYFGTSEQSALEQTEGGPCAIIAPVEAFILKKLLLEYNDLSFREKVHFCIY